MLVLLNQFLVTYVIVRSIGKHIPSSLACLLAVVNPKADYFLKHLLLTDFQEYCYFVVLVSLEW